jgi:hypothetical protein
MRKAKPVALGVLSFLVLCGLAQGTLAQSSTNYQNKEHVVNSGGSPSPVLASTNYSVTLSSIGDGLSATGMSSAGYSMEGGFPVSYPPPGEVLDLQFTNKTTMGWNPELSVGTYSVYRGLVSGLSSGYGTCLTSGLALTQATDATTPSAGQCFFYLVTAENRLTEEGTLGKKSDGTPRPNTAPCP